ncbi:MAG: SIMPL domain-containing protein [Pseudomonadota bacterium]
MNRFLTRRALAATLGAGAMGMMALQGPAVADETSQTMAKIMVSGTGSADVAPDMAVLNLTVFRQGETAREALNANNNAMAAVLAAMQSKGIAERDLQTANFNIRPRYERPKTSSGTQRDPIIIGYDVSNALTVRVRDLTILGDVLDTSVTLGVNQGGNVQFTNDDPSAAIETARINAMREAMRKAQVLTETAGVSLGNVIEITEQSFQPRPMPMARAEMTMASDAAVPIAAGENSYAVTVNVTYALDQ